MTLALTSTYSLVRCYRQDCGLDFALPDSWVTARKRDHAFWYCPNGHRQHWSGESDVERLERQLRGARARATAAEDQREAAERSARAYKGVATRVRRRAAHGVCPCCTRTFADVARHMQSRHPDFVAEHGMPEPADRG